MSSPTKAKGTIAILTGGGDVPGLNPAIRAVTVRALREGYRVLGIRRGWAGLVELERDTEKPYEDYVIELSEEIVNKVGRTGGTFLHTSRTRPVARRRRRSVPQHLKDRYHGDVNDLTPEVLTNLEWLGIDTLIPIGGDDTLSYGVRLHKEGVKVIAIPKTMDNDVPGTDYCIGFSHLRDPHDRDDPRPAHLGRVATSASWSSRCSAATPASPPCCRPWPGAANRCVIPEHVFDIEHLCELLTADRHTNPSQVLASSWSPRAPRSRAWTRWSSRTRRRTCSATRSWAGSATCVSRSAPRPLAEVQQRPAHQRHQPAPRLPRALRRPRRPRLDRADGVRQPRDGPRARRHLRPPRQRPQRRATTTSRSTS